MAGERLRKLYTFLFIKRNVAQEKT